VLDATTIEAIADELVEAGRNRKQNQTVEETGVAAGVLDHPANGVHWLANKIAAHGDSMKAGDIILAGSFTRPLWVYKGDTVHADYGPLGVVTCRFA